MLHLFFHRYLSAAFLLAAALCAAIPAEAGPWRPYGLHCEYRTNPLGVDTPVPRLGWKLDGDGRGLRQSAYRIVAAASSAALEDGPFLWDSGRVPGARCLHIVYAGEPLRSGQRVWWRVQAWDADGRASPWSEPAWWETALLDPADWGAEWIGDGRPGPETDEAFYADDPAPLFRKTFRAKGPIRRARLYFVGLGYGEALLNGRPAGDHVLDPGWTRYDERVLYSVYDVTGLLRPGENVLGAHLGNGWWNPLPLRMWGRRNIRDTLPVGRPCLKARLVIEYADNAVDVMVSDASWRTADGPVRFNSIYLGERYDARRERRGWAMPGYDDAAWAPARTVDGPAGRLTAQPQPPIRAHAVLEPVAVTERAPGVYLFDFGEQVAGWVRLRADLPEGADVRLRYGELVHPDGTLNPMTSVCGQIKKAGQGGPGAPAVAEQTDTWTAAGDGPAVYSPRFTFHVFRYVEVAGLRSPPSPETLQAVRLHSAVAPVGTFSCSSERLNAIQRICERTFVSNLFSVQSDCPHRERFGYGGDLVVTCDALLMNYDMHTFYAKAARDWDDSALPNGMLTDTAPFVGIQYCGVGWAMAHPVLLDRLWRYGGDRRLLEEQYETARGWLELVAAQYPGHVVTKGLSDHESRVPAPSGPLVTPLYAESARLAGALAARLGRDADAARYAALAEAAAAAWRTEFYRPEDGTCGPGTQAAQSFALALGMLPAEEKKVAFRRLVEQLEGPDGGRLTTGIFGTRFLPEVLADGGRADLALRLVDHDDEPGWGFMLKNGATTLWEHWAFSDNTYSHNHPMFGSVSGWFYQGLAGIRPHPDAEGFDRILLRPCYPRGLEHVRCRYESIRGPIVSNWTRRDGRIELEVVIPPNAEADLALPAGAVLCEDGRRLSPAAAPAIRSIAPPANGPLRLLLGSGRYVFEFDG